MARSQLATFTRRPLHATPPQTTVLSRAAWTNFCHLNALISARKIWLFKQRKCRPEQQNPLRSSKKTTTSSRSKKCRRGGRASPQTNQNRRNRKRKQTATKPAWAAANNNDSANLFKSSQRPRVRTNALVRCIWRWAGCSCSSRVPSFASSSPLLIPCSCAESGSKSMVLQA